MLHLKTERSQITNYIMSKVQDKLQAQHDAKLPVVGSAIVESRIKEIGWKLVKQYSHDQYNTNRYKLGCMEIEFTYEGRDLLTCDLTISELNCMPISFDEIKKATELLGHWSE